MKFSALTNINMSGRRIDHGDTVDIDLADAWQLCEYGAIYPIPSDLEEAERLGLPLKSEAAAEALRVRNARNETLQEAHRIRAEIAAIKKNASPEAWRIVEAEERQGKLALLVTDDTREAHPKSQGSYLRVIGSLLLEADFESVPPYTVAEAVNTKLENLALGLKKETIAHIVSAARTVIAQAPKK